MRSTELTPKISGDPMLCIGISQLLEKKSWSEGTPLLRNLIFYVSNWTSLSSYICSKWPHFRAHFERLVVDNFKNMSRMNPKFFDIGKSQIWPHIRKYKFSPKKSTFFDQTVDSQVGVITDPLPSKIFSTLYFTPMQVCVKFFWVGGSVLVAISRKRFFHA